MNLTHSQAVARLKEIGARTEELGAKHRLSREDDAELDKLVSELNRTNEHRIRLEYADELARGGGRFKIEAGSIGRDDDATDPYAAERGGTRDKALRCLDGLVSADRLPARSAETVEQLTRSGSMSEQSWTAKVVEATGSDSYLRAFSKLVRDPQRGHLLWTPQEAEAFRVVEGLRSETRAMSTTDAQGGFMSPLVIDPSILLTSAGSINPLRAISRVVQTVSDNWSGVTSAGVTAEWLAEAAQAADASPALSQPTIPVFKQSAFVPFSYEIGQDATNFATELGKLLMDGLDQLSNVAFTTGTGTGQPTGIITSLAGTASQVNTATGDTLVAGDVYNLQNQLPPRFSANAQWCATLSVYNSLRQMETAAGALRFPGLHDTPATLLGRNANEVSNMDGVIDAGQNNHIILYGDFSNFVVVDRYPSSLELIPNLFGANSRPTGQRGMFLWARVGSDSVVDNAFRLLTA